MANQPGGCIEPLRIARKDSRSERPARMGCNENVKCDPHPATDCMARYVVQRVMHKAGTADRSPTTKHGSRRRTGREIHVQRVIVQNAGEQAACSSSRTRTSSAKKSFFPRAPTFAITCELRSLWLAWARTKTPRNIYSTRVRLARNPHLSADSRRLQIMR